MLQQPRGDEMVSLDHAYRAMFRFLDSYWVRGGKTADELGVLLGAMDLSADGPPMDPAMWSDFLAAIDQNKAGV